MTLQELTAELRRRRVFHMLAAQVVVFGVLTASWYVMKPRKQVSAEEVVPKLDPTLVAVLPFRVGGAHVSLEYLGEGMVDLLALRLTGARRAVEPRVAIAAWQADPGSDDEGPLEAPARVAKRLHAGTVVVGTIVGSVDSITVRAALVDVATGRELAKVAEAGSAAELPALIDRLAAEALGLEAGAAGAGLAALASTSVMALQAYLDGNAHYRRAHYRQAVESYARALEEDSTFALAALQVIHAAALDHDAPGDWQTRGRALLLAHRDRLPTRLAAYAAARFPAEPATSVVDELARLEHVAHEFPEWPEAWYDFAHALYHSGALATDDERLARARAAFERAFALDSTNLAVLHHLLAIADRTGDGAFVARFGAQFLAAGPSAGPAFEHRLDAAHARGDDDALRGLYDGLDTLDVHVLTATIVEHQVTPRSLVRLDFARRATDLLLKQAINPAESDNARLYRYQIEMNAGRPHTALALLDSVTPRDRLAWDRRRIYDAVYWDGDSAAAAAAAVRVERHLKRATRGPLTDADASAQCALTTLRLSRGDTKNAAAAIKRLRGSRAANTAPTGRQLCALILAARLSSVQGTADAEARLIELDSVLRTGPLVAGFREHGNITAARLFYERGDVHRALAAARRRLFQTGGQSYVSTFLELECSLTIVDRDRAGADRACTRYLTLRTDAEAGRAEKAAHIRAELERIGADRQ